jgi:hypothetical protein
MPLTRSSAIAVLLALLGCGDELTRPDQIGDVDAATPPEFDPGEPVLGSPQSCDPLGLNGELTPTDENIALALQQECFHSGDGRRKLVFEALCQRDLRCTKAGAATCLANYEAKWQERLRPRGLSVHCADALLDAMSCLAQTTCDAADACAGVDERAETTCDPNTPLPGSPMCPPLPQDRELTKGPLPTDAVDDAGRLDESRVPDFIPALDREGEIAGYVRYCAIRGGGAIPVYADDLETLVGHMVPGRGFVPGPLSGR